MSVPIRAAVGLAALALAVAGPGLAQAPAGFTAEQAARGLEAFSRNCSGCHGANLGGGEGTPALRGPEFMFNWKGKSAAALYGFIHDNMPPGQQGVLTDVEYTEVVAAILSANGMEPGSAPLPVGAAAAGVTIRPPE